MNCKITVCVIILILLFGCGKHKQSDDVAWSTKRDSVLFKRWLVDTVKLIKHQSLKDSIVIYQDSSSMDL